MDRAKKRCDTEVAAVGLPDDPLVDILSRIPAKSICRFKCVSKGWRDLIADPLHRTKLAQTLEGFFFMVKLHECHGESKFKCSHEPCTCYGGDGKRLVSVDSDKEELTRYGFVDVLQRSVRLIDFYLTELPGIRNSRLVHCCNGLLLFAVKGSSSYVVCNPATEEYVLVPSSGPGVSQRDTFCGRSGATYLLFDPAGAPCDFNLVEFAQERFEKSLCVYSSKTQAWSHKKHCYIKFYAVAPDRYPSVFVNGMLYLLPRSKDELLVLDVEVNIQKIIPLPCRTGREKWTSFGCIGWSQGRLHYISSETPAVKKNISSEIPDDDEEIDGDGCARTEPSFRGFLIWVLEDYERQQWVLKDTVNFYKLFGETKVHGVSSQKRKRKKNVHGHGAIHFNCNVLGIHPDHSLFFLHQFWDRKLISYCMDTKEVCDLCSLEHGYECITPYVPCFSEIENWQ